MLMIRLISLFKKMNTRIEILEDKDSNNSIEELTLKKLILWTYEPLERMKWLSICCESIYSNNI